HLPPAERVLVARATALAIGDAEDDSEKDRRQRDHLEISHRLHGVVEEEAGDDERYGADRDREREPPLSRIERALGPSYDGEEEPYDLAAKMKDDRGERADVDGDIEGKPLILPAEKP